VVATPLAGVGSELFTPVSMGRKAKGVALKESYFQQLAKKMKEVKSRFAAEKIVTLFDTINSDETTP